jgi:APA family basic amino acid/polyamine antiporter
MANTTSRFRPDMGRLDFTLLVIGAVIGADVYVVASMGAQFLGPAQLVAWAAAGVLAAFIALAFVQCAAIDSDVGGSYAYARSAFGPFVGFLAGWALYAGEWVALPVFPLAFVNYANRLLPGDMPWAAATLVKVALIATVTTVNLAGVRKGALLNDVLTIGKLLPLGVLIVLGLAFAAFHHGQTTGHLQPFAPIGWGGFGSAIVPIFWAYAGFELAVLPAAEVREPGRTLPQGLVVGMIIATFFYVLSAFAVVAALSWQDAAASSSPLAAALRAILDGFGGPAGAGAVLMSIGALVSIAGVYDVFSLGVARLSYALAADGLFPAAFARLHPRFGTPYGGLLFQAAFAVVGATLFDLRGLITIAVFFLGLCYVLTALAALRLVERQPERALHVPGLRAGLLLAALSGGYLASQAGTREISIGSVVMLFGAAVYFIRGAQWRAVAFRVETWERWAEHHHLWLLRSIRRRPSDHR